jgi:hypothetical protein
MPTEITDPATLNFLNALSNTQQPTPTGTPLTGTEITDPDTIRMLNAATANQPTTGPSPSVLRAWWSGATTPAQPTPEGPTASVGRMGIPLGGFAGNRIPGFVQGLRDPLDAAAALAAQSAYAVAPNQWTAGQVAATNAANTAAMQQYQAARGNWPGFDPLRTTGNIVSTAPIGATAGALAGPGFWPGMAGATGAGAVSGALTPQLPASPGSPQYWGNVASNTLAGGVFGAGSTALLGTAGGLVAPQAGRVGPLTAQDVVPTIGQTGGGLIDMIERLFARVPIAGAPIAAARARTGEDLYRGAMNQVLAPIGESLDAATASGRPAMQEVQSKVSNAYNTLLPNLSVTLDPQLTQDLATLGQLPLPADRAAQLNDLVQSEIFDRLSPRLTMSGDVFKDAESGVGNDVNNYLNSSIGDERRYGQAALQLQGYMRDWLTRSNPAQAQDLANANMSWALLKRVQRAGSYTGAQDGIFTPAQLDSAIKAQSPESRFAAGEALMQPYAELGRNVLGTEVPHGGFGANVGMGAALTAAAIEDPSLLKYGLPIGAGMAALYSRPVQRVLGAGLTNPPYPYVGTALPQTPLTTPLASMISGRFFGPGQ